MRNPGFPNDDLARAALLIKSHEAAKADREAGSALISERALADLERVRTEFNGFVELYTSTMVARDTLQVDDPAKASGEPDELERKLLDARRLVDRTIRRVCAEINVAIAEEPEETQEETFRRYGYRA